MDDIKDIIMKWMSAEDPLLLAYILFTSIIIFLAGRYILSLHKKIEILTNQKTKALIKIATIEKKE